MKLSKFRNSKFNLTVGFVFLIAISLVIIDLKMKKNSNILYRVDNVISATSLELSSGQVIELSGFSGKQDECIARIHELTAGYRVFVTKTDDMKFDVFVWGVPEEILNRKPIGWEAVGAHNVYVGFLNKQKGSCVYLNKVLIAEGFLTGE